jgi:hypothetical protein
VPLFFERRLLCTLGSRLIEDRRLGQARDLAQFRRARETPILISIWLPLIIGFGSLGVLTTSLFSTAKRNAHCSENGPAQEHDSILAIYEPAVKRFERYSRSPPGLLACFT